MDIVNAAKALVETGAGVQPLTREPGKGTQNTSKFMKASTPIKIATLEARRTSYRQANEQVDRIKELEKVEGLDEAGKSQLAAAKRELRSITNHLQKLERLMAEKENLARSEQAQADKAEADAAKAEAKLAALTREAELMLAKRAARECLLLGCR